MSVYEKLFNLILDNGIVPTDWLKGNIIPLYNTRAVKRIQRIIGRLLCLAASVKIFTSILNTRVTKYLELNRILNETQSGFRKEYSTLDNVMTLYGLIQYFKSNKKKLCCCFINFTKAFDDIWRAVLWQKLLENGIRGKFLTVIQNMFKEIQSCITVNGNPSGFFSCEKGVRKGENISPLLFAIYLNDLDTYIDLYNYKGVEIGIQNENVLIFFKLLLSYMLMILLY